jgi:hypothetical protein
MADSINAQPRRLSDRDAAALRALHALAGEDGWSRSPRGRRLDRSGLSWDQWRRAVDALRATGLIERVDGKRSAGEPDSYRLTIAGHEALTCGDRHTPPQVTATPPATPLGSCSSVSQLIKRSEERNNESSDGGMAAGMAIATGGVAPPQVPPPQVDVVRLLERVTLAMERANVHHTVSLDDALCALLREALASRAAPPPVAPQPTAPSGGDAPPECDCDLPMKHRNGARGPFWGCARWRGPSEPGCGKTLTIGAEPHHRTSESQSEAARRERDEARAKAEADRQAVLSALADGLSVKERVALNKAAARPQVRVLPPNEGKVG